MSQSSGVTPSLVSAVPSLSEPQRAWMLLIMTLVAVCSQLDRSIVGMVLEPIRHEFSLSDAQLGIAAGLAFSIAHAVVAIPLGRLADKTNRRNLIAACLVVWSAMTALCGVAGNFLQLVLARMGVGAGEAGGQAASLSVVSDLYGEKRRATAIAIFYLSGPLGAILAGMLGGPVTAEYGWRAALLIAGAPGLLMAVVLMLCGKDPPREAPSGAVSRAAPGFGDVVRFIRGQRALLHLFAGLTLVTFTLSGVGAFAVSFFIRYHGMSQQDMGVTLGLTGATAALVMLGSSILADRLGRRDPRWRLWLIIPVEIAITLLLLAAYTAGGVAIALPAFVAAFLLSQVWIGPGLATAQSLTPSNMRATGAAILFVINNLVGFGFGPVILGGLSDALAAQTGGDGLRWALIIVALLNVWGAAHFFLAARTLKADLARAAAAT